MTNKLVVTINSLKVPKIKKILLHEMKFLVPNYSCLQNPWLVGYRPQIPVLSVLCPQLNLLNPPPRTKFLGTPLRRTNNLTTFMCRLSWNMGVSTSWNPQDLSRPTKGQLCHDLMWHRLLHHQLRYITKPLQYCVYVARGDVINWNMACPNKRAIFIL